jgi:serine protease Do
VRLGMLSWAALVALATGACGGAAKSGSESETASSLKPERLTPADIAERATPSIVAIRTESGLGTGFVVREDGWIVTNLHVVVGSDEVIVHLPDRSEYPVVEIVNASAKHDLVVLRIDVKKKLRPLPLGDSKKLRAGDPVVAIGHPLGLEDTVSNGLLSGVRNVDGVTLLQVSAPIAPGSSGGPLFNEQGEVIGVATLILLGGQNLNLGLPAGYVKDLLDNPEPISFREFVAVVSKLRKSNGEPRPNRRIPRHPPSVFAGCADSDVVMLAHGISDAISVGAPLYNEGNHRACFQIYQGAASDIETRLPKACQGPKRALAQGRARASQLRSPTDQAWAMRDAFDGLAEAIVRRSKE